MAELAGNRRDSSSTVCPVMLIRACLDECFRICLRLQQAMRNCRLLPTRRRMPTHQIPAGTATYRPGSPISDSLSIMILRSISLPSPRNRKIHSPQQIFARPGLISTMSMALDPTAARSFTRAIRPTSRSRDRNCSSARPARRPRSRGVFPNDLPRSPEGRALIGDHRNDENLLVAQTQLAFLKFHNKVVDRLASRPHSPSPGQLFAEARKQVIWHYQWMVLHDWVERITETGIVAKILHEGRKFYRFHKVPYMPVEL